MLLTDHHDKPLFIQLKEVSKSVVTCHDVSA